MADHENFTKAVFWLLPEVHVPVERKRYVENFLTPSSTGLREYLNVFSAGE